MMLTIHGLPSSVSHQELKMIIKKESNLHSFIMDNLVADGNGTKKVKIGVADASEGNHLLNCLNGFQLRESTLRVVPVGKASKNTQGNFNQCPGGYPTYNNTQGQHSNYGNYPAGPMGAYSSTWAPPYHQWNPQQQMLQNNYGFPNGPIPDYAQQWQQQVSQQQYQQQQPQSQQQHHYQQQQQYQQQQHQNQQQQHQYQQQQNQKQQQQHQYQQQQHPQQQDQQQQQIENELLKKKRQLIVEERRLLEKKLQAEKKKLEMLQGSSSNQKVASASKKKKKKSKKVNPKPKDYIPIPRGKGGVHTFAMPCKHLLKQMRPVVCKVTRERDVKHHRRKLMKKLRDQLRIILTKLVEGRGYMMTGPLIALFRQHYPVEGDEAFVTKVHNTLGHVPMKKKKKEKEAAQKALREKKRLNSASIKKEEPNAKDSARNTDQAESSSVANPVGCSNGAEKSETADVEDHIAVDEEDRSNNDGSSQDTLSSTYEHDDDDWATNGVDWDDDN